jgi:hypothetical protein
MRHLTIEERDEQIRLYAYHWWEIRMKYGLPGSPDGDWAKAETMVSTEYRMENARDKA